MACWDEFLTDRDRAVFAKSGYGSRQGFGRSPALLVVDVTYAFVGDHAEPILRAVERYRTACGEEGWASVEQIRTLIETARGAGVPVVYTRGVDRRGDDDAGRWASKNARAREDYRPDRSRGNEIVEPIAPQRGDLVIAKAKPSAFFGTPLLSYLIAWQVDTLLVAGGTTSGCVRATVVDAFSYNFLVSVVAEACFDRGQASHAINLFDMQASTPMW
jgi:nicotinamidase-related amidase